ncbi:trypsin-like peptidase domain-containing protein [Lentibacter algarum]|uniref:serine protease n=1 Tax=Lentibacter algarum TaxID=576131 RepID=UPI001C096E3C|nr:serine protease [Lentibacter algarum]MBU2983467.1 trypsin-like peptidase domain-containing protein [Lentibacter algarum]
MKRLAYSIFLIAVLTTRAAFAQSTTQDPVWIQIEAQPSLSRAQERARAFSATLPDVNGFALGGGWYGVALGPYLPDDAREVLRVYRSEGQIPRDSYIAYSSSFRQQFWPLGANLLSLPSAVTPQTTEGPDQEATAPAEETQQAAQETVVTTPEPQIAEPDESPSEARASERELTREERMKLQTALAWAGFYNAAIDGAYGRGTRNSMAQWQDANNHVKTGILTTKQRAELLSQYNAILADLGMKLVRNDTAGIEMMMPTAVVDFSKYSPPFVHFDSSGDIDARVLMISQAGDQDTLYGLYDIMQTLEIVPDTGPRERRKNSFTLVGEGADFISYSEASLEDGEIKGFTLIWPAGDEERRRRLLNEMRASFNRTIGAMSPAAGSDEQDIDLVSGLEIRRPKLARSGFFIDASGHIATTSQAVAACGRITVDDEYEAEVLAEKDGVAILRPKEALSPALVATLRASAPRLQSEIAVSGFSYEGILGGPTLTFGRLTDIKGLAGEPVLKRLALNALPGDAGGPVFDDAGAVLGMLLPAPEGDKKLPEQVSFAIDTDTIISAAAAAGLTATSQDRNTPIAAEDLTDEAMAVTVLVSCWE